MAGELYKYLLVGAGAFIIGGLVGAVRGVTKVCNDPLICDVLRRKKIYDDFGIPSSESNPRPNEWAVDRGYRER